ncbi:unnamed protein product, partial [Pylaiella littoralis]
VEDAPLSHCSRDDNFAKKLDSKQQCVEGLPSGPSSSDDAVIWESSTSGSEQQRADGASLSRSGHDDDARVDTAQPISDAFLSPASSDAAAAVAGMYSPSVSGSPTVPCCDDENDDVATA